MTHSTRFRALCLGLTKATALCSSIVALMLATPPLAAQGPVAVDEPAASGLLTPLRRQAAGEEIRLRYRSPAVTETRRDAAVPAWSETIYDPGATYIAPHFAHLDLPPGAHLVVRSPDGARHWTYRGAGPGARGAEGGFWGIHIAGDTALVELFASEPVAADAMVIDSYARGFDQAFAPPTKSICGANNSLWAKCYQSTKPTHYAKSRAVARLLIEGIWHCTGWLVGSQGHLMTAHHCIGSSAQALDTDYELMAEGSSCSVSCASGGACSGNVVATQATLIQTDTSLDYTLVKLPTNPTASYGYLQMREAGPAVNEKFYLPQHPLGWGKRIALASTDAHDQSGICEVATLSHANPVECPAATVGHYCDTSGGSSGAPLIGYTDHAVLALHTCGGCDNGAVPIDAIVDDLYLMDNLPPNGVIWDQPPCAGFCHSQIPCSNDCMCGPGTCYRGRCSCEI